MSKKNTFDPATWNRARVTTWLSLHMVHAQFRQNKWITKKHLRKVSQATRDVNSKALKPQSAWIYRKMHQSSQPQRYIYVYIRKTYRAWIAHVLLSRLSSLSCYRVWPHSWNRRVSGAVARDMGRRAAAAWPPYNVTYIYIVCIVYILYSIVGAF